MAKKESHHKGHGKTYIKVWVGLLILTVTTVAVSYHNFGTWNIVVAMLVATLKAALVCLFFMHLYYDNRVNQVAFVSAFVFLGIFAALTASDELFRPTERPVAVAAAAAPSGAEMNKLRIATPSQVAKGKQLFSVQCVVCHGANGKGDGPAAATLNPHPRDFTSGYWRYGGQPTHVFKTISEGSPGTAMAGFSSLSADERWTLVHFVRSFSPKAPDDSPEDLKAAGLDKTAEEAKSAPTEPTQKIPLSFVMKRLAEPETPTVDAATLPKIETESVGGKIYQEHCMSCHGANGHGGIPVAKVSANPPAYLKTFDFAKATGAWTGDRSQFIDLVSKGLPGSGMPGQANFSNEEWSGLYQHVQSLRLRP